MKNLQYVFLKIFLMILSLSWGDKVIGMQDPKGEEKDWRVTQRVHIPEERAADDEEREDATAGKDRKESDASAASGQTVSSDGYDADSSYPPSAAGSRMLLGSDQPIKLRWTRSEIFTSNILSAETITPQFRTAVEALIKILYDDFVAHQKNKIRKSRRFWQQGGGQEAAATGGLYRDSESEEEEMAGAIKGAVAHAVESQSLKPEPFKEPIPHIIHTLIQMMQGPGVPEALLFVVRDYEGIIGNRRDIRPFIFQFVGTAASSRNSARTHGISVAGLLDD